MFDAVQKTSLAGSVYAQVRDAILSGALAPGADLPAERDLAASFAVNRSAVREALKRLEQARLVSIQHGGNTRVLDLRRHGGPELLVELVERDPVLLDDVRELAVAMLPDAARAAAERATATQIDRLDMLVRLIDSEDAEQRRDLAGSFWDALVDASGNVAFRLVYNVVSRAGPELPDADPIVFAELANAIAAGDVRGAEMATRAMLG